MRHTNTPLVIGRYYNIFLRKNPQKKLLFNFFLDNCCKIDKKGIKPINKGVFYG